MASWTGCTRNGRIGTTFLGLEVIDALSVKASTSSSFVQTRMWSGFGIGIDVADGLLQSKSRSGIIGIVIK